MLSHYTAAPTARSRGASRRAWRWGGRAALAEADKRDGQVVAARIGGDSVLVCDGYLEID